MKGFFIEITNNLLDPKHRKKMGTAVWEFMWCLDKITKIDEDQIGWVLGGKPINLLDIKEDIGITEPKISKNLNKLQKEGYLKLKRTPYGLIISVNKAKKRFNQKVKTDLSKRENLNVLKGKSNKTIQLDNTTPKGGNEVALIRNYFTERCKKAKGFEPEMAFGKEGKLLQEKLKRYSVEQIKDLIDKFLNSKTGEDLGITLSICLSAHTINLWQADKLEKPKRPYYLGDLVVEKNGRKYVIHQGEWLEFAGLEKEIEYR